MENISNTHGGKAESYDIGRPEYPEAFFDFLYNEVGFNPNNVIADIGCGTGKVTKHFLERGNKVIAIEPDSDMRRIADKKLSKYPKYSSFQKTAEDTGIESNSIDRIFCGNSYYWFERGKVVPEFKRISRKNGSVVMSWVGSDIFIKYNSEFSEIYRKYSKPVFNKRYESPAFLPETFIEKAFSYTVCQTIEEFLHGVLSESGLPVFGDDTYEPCCNEIKELFYKYSNNEKLETTFRLRCMVGNVENLGL